MFSDHKGIHFKEVRRVLQDQAARKVLELGSEHKPFWLFKAAPTSCYPGCDWTAGEGVVLHLGDWRRRASCTNCIF